MATIERFEDNRCLEEGFTRADAGYLHRLEADRLFKGFRAEGPDKAGSCFPSCPTFEINRMLVGLMKYLRNSDYKGSKFR